MDDRRSSTELLWRERNLVWKSSGAPLVTAGRSRLAKPAIDEMADRCRRRKPPARSGADAAADAAGASPASPVTPAGARGGNPPPGPGAAAAADAAAASPASLFTSSGSSLQSSQHRSHSPRRVATREHWLVLIVTSLWPINHDWHGPSWVEIDPIRPRNQPLWSFDLSFPSVHLFGDSAGLQVPLAVLYVSFAIA